MQSDDKIPTKTVLKYALEPKIQRYGMTNQREQAYQNFYFVKSSINSTSTYRNQTSGLPPQSQKTTLSMSNYDGMVNRDISAGERSSKSNDRLGIDTPNFANIAQAQFGS